MQHRLSVMEEELDKAEAKAKDAKAVQEEGEVTKSAAESMQRKIQLLEDELDVAEKNVKETMEK